MKKARVFAVLMILTAGFSFGQGPHFQLSLLGGASRIFAYGSDDDYVMGSNDFPVTPAHTPLGFGAAFTYYLSNRWGVELRGEAALAATMNLTDPSDQDTVSIKSSRHYAISLNLVYELSAGRLRPYFVLGGGADKLSGSSVTAVSDHGYEVTLSPPAKTLNGFANAGGGLRFWIFRSLGAQVDLRYRFLFGDPDNIHSLVAAAGVLWRF